MGSQELGRAEGVGAQAPVVTTGAEAPWHVPAEVLAEMPGPYKRRRRLRRYPLGLVVAKALDGIPPDPADVDLVMASLNAQGKGAWRPQLAAAWLIGYMPLSAQQRASAVLMLRQQLVRKEYTKRRLLWFFAATSAQGVMVPLALLGEWRRMKLHAALVHSLGRLPEVESIVPVIGALRERRPFPTPKVRDEARRVLPGLLSLLTPEHYGRVSAETVRSLCDLAYYMEDESLAVGALRALEKVGGGSAVEAVSLLTRDRQDMPAVAAEAGRILPVLLERKRREDQASTLLRPAAGEDAERTLLRAAGGSGEAQPEVLLRATEGEEA